MFIARASLPVQPLPSIKDRTSLSYVLPSLPAFLVTLAWFFNDQCGRTFHIKRNNGGLIAGGGSKRAVPNEFSNARKTKRTKRRPVGENCGEEESGGDDYSDRESSADENKDYQDHSDGKVLCPLDFKRRKNQRYEKYGVEKCLLTFSTLKESFEHALQKHTHCRQCRKSLFESGKNIEHLTLHEISEIFFNEHKYLRDHILRAHLNVFRCRIDDEDDEYCDKGPFGLHVSFRRHKETHNGYKGKDKNDWQSYWSRAQQELKKTRPSKWKVFDSVSKCSDTQRLNHIVATYYDHKVAIDNDTTSQVFDSLSKDLHHVGIPEIAINGFTIGAYYQDGTSAVISMESPLPVTENTVQPLLSNASNGYSASNSGDFYSAPESFYTAPAGPRTCYSSIPDCDAPQTVPNERQGLSAISPQNQILSHAGGGMGTKHDPSKFVESAKTFLAHFMLSEWEGIQRDMNENSDTFNAILNFLSIDNPNGQQTPSNSGSDRFGTVPPNLHNSQNLNNLGDPTYNTPNAFSTFEATATIGSGHEMQPFTPHTVVPVNQNTTPPNPLNQQNLNSGQFSNRPGPSSAAERIESWNKDSNSLHRRLYERGLSRGKDNHDHTGGAS